MKIRSFICAEFDDEIIKELTRIQSILENIKFKGKIVEPENLHLTFKFLGEIDESKLDKIKELLREVKFKKFEVSLGKVGIFSHRGNPRIIWVKLEGKGIFELQNKIDDILKDEFEKEQRFMSHITLARVKYVKDKEGFLKYILGVSPKKVSSSLRSFKLKKSELDKIGPIYTDLEIYLAND